MNDFERWIIFLLLCFPVGAALAHALYQPQHNAIDTLKAQIQTERDRAVIGYLVWDALQERWQYTEKPR